MSESFWQKCNNFARDVIDRICFHLYGEKSLRTIKLERLKNVREGENDLVVLRTFPTYK